MTSDNWMRGRPSRRAFLTGIGGSGIAASGLASGAKPKANRDVRTFRLRKTGGYGEEVSAMDQIGPVTVEETDDFWIVHAEERIFEERPPGQRHGCDEPTGK